MTEIGTLYRRLLDRYGPQRWWPSEHPFETIAGAVLVQRTSWSNAASAIRRLQERDLLDPESIDATAIDELAETVRPAGFFNVKAQRLKSVARFIMEAGGLESLQSESTESLREKLLSIAGIGPETADAMLLYAFGRRTVVIDEYYRRLMSRLIGRDRSAPTDAAIRRTTENAIQDVQMLNELHALVVAHGKSHCGRKPLCIDCCLADLCATAGASITATR
jgi:endonuclease-3 related protein